VRRRRRDDTAHDTNDGRTLIFTLTHCGGAVQGRDAMKAIGEATAVTAQLGRLKQQRPRSTRDGVSGREARPLLTQQLRRALTAAAASGTRAPPEEAPIRRGASARGYAQHAGRGQAGQRLDRAVLRRALAAAVPTASRFVATVVCRWQRIRDSRAHWAAIRPPLNRTYVPEDGHWVHVKTSSMRSFPPAPASSLDGPAEGAHAMARAARGRCMLRLCDPRRDAARSVSSLQWRSRRVAVRFLGGSTLQNLRLTRSCIRVSTCASPAR
jgi:hypothetical protein